jgi:hypothetical protein
MTGRGDEMMTDFSNTDDIIDVRDIIARVEELEALVPETPEDVMPGTGEEREENALELDELTNLLDALEGMGGDEQRRGDWYPVTLVRDSYFRDYAQETAEDCGLIPEDAGWPSRCIDWDQAARELRMDYSSIEYGGVTYWTR